jgi:hypothetical protein
VEGSITCHHGRGKDGICNREWNDDSRIFEDTEDFCGTCKTMEVKGYGGWGEGVTRRIVNCLSEGDAKDEKRRKVNQEKNLF